MERPFFRRTWVLVLIGVIVFLVLFMAVTVATVYGRRQRELNATPTPSLIPTAAPSATPLPNYHAISFYPDLTRMEGMTAVVEGHRQELGMEYWVDITPANMILPAEAEDGPAARVGWLDLTTLENRSAAFLLKNGVLALAENDGRIMLYRADLSTTESRGFYAIDFIAPLGELLERDSALFLEIE